MKKALILMALLLTLTVGGTGLALADINAAKDQVEMTRIDMYGDPKLADGLTVRTRNTYRHQLFWDTTYQIGEQSKIQTEYDFSFISQPEYAESQSAGVVLESYLAYGFDEATDEPQEGLAQAYKELYDSLEPGEEAYKVINIGDYLTYYPLFITLELPGAPYIFLASDQYENTMSENERKRVDPALKLREYFQIPVIDGEQVEIYVGKSTDDRQSADIGSSDVPFETSDRFDFISMCAISDDTCYFTFKTHTEQGHVVDVSHLPDGYGIYALPYRENTQGNNSYDMEAFRVAYPLDPSIEVLGLNLSTDQTQLLLHAIEDNQYIITVIDLKTMQAVQKLTICEWPVQYFGWSLYEGEGFMVIGLFEDRLAVVRLDETGQYQLDFITEIAAEEQDIRYVSEQTEVDYDGQYLVMADYVAKFSCCDFFIAIYDAGGLAYYGEYQNSLTQNPAAMISAVGSQIIEYQTDGCNPMEVKPLTVKLPAD